MPLRHPCADLLLKLRQPFGPPNLHQSLQVRRPVRIDAQLGIVGEAGIDFRRRGGQFVLQSRGEILSTLGHTERSAIDG